METQYKDKAIVALRYFSDFEVPRIANNTFDPEVDGEAVKHLRTCDSCREWIHEYAGPSLMERQSKLSQYCCPQMFGAVEEPKNLRLQLSMARDSGLQWFLNGQTVINYCPWCGKKLPFQPFVMPSQSC
ncbi:hypothetical protein [uncultured Microbulbifer sp.]|uniref:hypothetical protein n=1 Tax=uncultured Microbulbifer sp. TaxID=348147 RepID=UPI0025FEA50B|nr:hypothetical protein [uncultured Microbulbifer sp.]